MTPRSSISLLPIAVNDGALLPICLSATFIQFNIMNPLRALWCRDEEVNIVLLFSSSKVERSSIWINRAWMHSELDRIVWVLCITHRWRSRWPNVWECIGCKAHQLKRNTFTGNAFIGNVNDLFIVNFVCKIASIYLQPLFASTKVYSKYFVWSQSTRSADAYLWAKESRSKVSKPLEAFNLRVTIAVAASCGPIDPCKLIQVSCSTYCAIFKSFDFRAMKV